MRAVFPGMTFTPLDLMITRCRGYWGSDDIMSTKGHRSVEGALFWYLAFRIREIARK
jgi:hypothetical protein